MLDVLYGPGAVVGVHGSWNRASAQAPEVSFFGWRDGTLGPQQTLVGGFQDDDGSRWGRPVAAVTGPDGAVYITDDEVNLQGFLLRHITIPEIGFNDTFSGWHGQGFVRVDQNVLPARWTVQLVDRTTHGVKAPVLALNAGQRGSVTIKPKHLGLKNLVVAVFMAAPKTTTKATYHLMVGGG